MNKSTELLVSALSNLLKLQRVKVAVKERTIRFGKSKYNTVHETLSKVGYKEDGYYAWVKDKSIIVLRTDDLIVVLGSEGAASEFGNLKFGNLDLLYCKSLTSLPSDLSVKFKLDLENCTNLINLSSNLNVGTLCLVGCTSLTSLPSDLKVRHELYLKNCTSLTSLPSNLNVGGDLNLRGCTSLLSLPSNLKVGRNIIINENSSIKIPDILKSKINSY